MSINKIKMMKKLEHEFNLIQGTFTGPETNELLSALFQDKLRFHSIKSFSHQERFGKPDVYAEERIKTLQETLEKALNLLKNYNQDSKFEIYADVKIKVAS